MINIFFISDLLEIVFISLHLLVQVAFLLVTYCCFAALH